MARCSRGVSALLPRDQQSGLRALPGRHGHHGGGRPRVDPAGQRQHRVAANVPSHLRPAEAQVGAGGVPWAGRALRPAACGHLAWVAAAEGACWTSALCRRLVAFESQLRAPSAGSQLRECQGMSGRLAAAEGCGWAAWDSAQSLLGPKPRPREAQLPVTAHTVAALRGRAHLLLRGLFCKREDSRRPHSFQGDSVYSPLDSESSS